MRRRLGIHMTPERGKCSTQVIGSNVRAYDLQQPLYRLSGVAVILNFNAVSSTGCKIKMRGPVVRLKIAERQVRQLNTATQGQHIALAWLP